MSNLSEHNPQFQADANVMPMTEKMIMQILQKNNLLTGNKTFGVVEEVINKTTLLVYMQHSNTSEIVKCSPHVPFHLGDRVLVEYINNNPHDRFVLGVIKGGYDIDQIDYNLLPDEPVQIIRDDNGRAYKFIYGYNNPRTTWEQELIRNDEGKVEQVVHYYPDGFVLIRTLIRDAQGRLRRYE